MNYFFILLIIIITLIILITIIRPTIIKLNKYIKKGYQECFTNNTIEEFLLQNKLDEFIYIPNGGNGGDSLIAMGTYYLFDKLRLKYHIGEWNKTYQQKILIYGGGGNFNGKIYNGCGDFIMRNHKKELNNKIIILPHTIANNDELLKQINSNVILMCREKYSYNYVSKIVKYPQNIYLFDDMAFQLKFIINNINNINNINKNKYSSGNFFRTDNESKNNIIKHKIKNNSDLSLKILYDPTMRNKQLVFKNSYDIIMKINEYQEINTDRLHLAITGSLLNKKVNFYQNNYYKNKAVYEYSLQHKYPNTKLIN